MARKIIPVSYSEKIEGDFILTSVYDEKAETLKTAETSASYSVLSLNVTGTESATPFAIPVKKVVLRNLGAKVVKVRFNDPANDQITLNANESMTIALAVTSVRAVCPTAADTSTVEVIGTR